MYQYYIGAGCRFELHTACHFERVKRVRDRRQTQVIRGKEISRYARNDKGRVLEKDTFRRRKSYLRFLTSLREVRNLNLIPSSHRKQRAFSPMLEMKRKRNDEEGKPG